LTHINHSRQQIAAFVNIPFSDAQTFIKRSFEQYEEGANVIILCKEQTLEAAYFKEMIKTKYNDEHFLYLVLGNVTFKGHDKPLNASIVLYFMLHRDDFQ
jgi:hypothetical protein